MIESYIFIFITTSCVLWSVSDASLQDTELKRKNFTANNIGMDQNLKGIALDNDETDLTKQLPFTNPCSCELSRCTCCAGIHIIGFGFDREACAVVNYESTDNVVRLELFMNNASVYNNRISTRNQQVCVPILPVTLIGPFDICVRLYDMNVVEQRLHACLAMLGRVAQYPVLTLQFNCMELGPGGVALTGPIAGDYSESGSNPSNNKTSTSTTPASAQQGSEVYDPVSEGIPSKKP